MRWALGLEYDGSAYHGWQSQSALALNTLQSQVEQALSGIAAHPVQVVCGGRTDRGVHATGQVIHFDSTADRKVSVWIAGTNHLLPADIRVLWAHEVDPEFHARYSAHARRYLYVIYNFPLRPALLRRQVTWIPYAIEVAQMQLAANFLLGEHDFSAFRGAHCQAKTAVRRIEYITVQRQGDFVVIDVQANAFLHHMVRNITGVLLAVGASRREPQWVAEVLQGRDRKLAGVTAPANGLYLAHISYSAQWGLPVAKGAGGILSLPH